MFDFDNPLTYKAYVQMSPLTIRYEYEHDLQEDFWIKILCITFIEDINVMLTRCFSHGNLPMNKEA